MWFNILYSLLWVFLIFLVCLISSKKIKKEKARTEEARGVAKRKIEDGDYHFYGAVAILEYGDILLLAKKSNEVISKTFLIKASMIRDEGLKEIPADKIPMGDVEILKRKTILPENLPRCLDPMNIYIFKEVVG